MKKFIAVLVCLLTILLLFSCNNDIIESIEQSTYKDSEFYLDTSNDTYVNYDSILRVYRLIVDSYPIVNQNSRAIAWELGIRDEDEFERFSSLYSSVFDFYPGRGELDSNSPHHKLGCGYVQKDLNSDGVDELILINSEYYIMAIFSYADGKPILLGNYMPRRACWIDGEGRLHENASGGAMCFCT